MTMAKDFNFEYKFKIHNSEINLTEGYSLETIFA